MTPEERKEYNRRYYQEKKEKFKEYRILHSEEIKEYRDKYIEEHKEYFKEKRKQHYIDHFDKYKEYSKNRYQDKKCKAPILASSYRQQDERNGFDTSKNITAEWIIANIYSGQKCTYCEEKDWTKLGVDRIDNSKPHTPENCVCCCKSCNYRRGNRYTFEEFIENKTER